MCVCVCECVRQSLGVKEGPPGGTGGMCASQC